MSLPTNTAAFEELSHDHAFMVGLHEAFGFPESTFAGWRFWHRLESGAVWMAGKDVRPISGVPTGAFGLMANKDISQPTRLSAGFIQRFGRLATSGTLTLGLAGTRLFASGGSQPWPEGVPPAHYVIVFGTLSPSGEHTYVAPIGRGRFERGILCSDLPKSLRFDSEVAADK